MGKSTSSVAERTSYPVQQRGETNGEQMREGERAQGDSAGGAGGGGGLAGARQPTKPDACLLKSTSRRLQLSSNPMPLHFPEDFCECPKESSVLVVSSGGQWGEERTSTSTTRQPLIEEGEGKRLHNSPTQMIMIICPKWHYIIMITLQHSIARLVIITSK